MNTEEEKIKLIRRGDQVFLQIPESGEEKRVLIIRTRPISGKGLEISLTDERKREVLTVNNLDFFDAESRKIVEQELEQRYLFPKIISIFSTRPLLSNYYWDVMTDRGRRKFVMIDPVKNMIWISEDQLIIRESMGIHFKIESLSALDVKSRGELAKVV